jgi:hypothetical protein
MHRHADTGPSHKRKSGYWLQIWIGYIVTNYRYTKVTIHRRRSKEFSRNKREKQEKVKVISRWPVSSGSTRMYRKLMQEVHSSRARVNTHPNKIIVPVESSTVQYLNAPFNQRNSNNKNSPPPGCFPGYGNISD